MVAAASRTTRNTGGCFSRSRPFQSDTSLRNVHDCDLDNTPAELDRLGSGRNIQINGVAFDLSSLIANAILARPGARSGYPDSGPQWENPRIRRDRYSCNRRLAFRRQITGAISERDELAF
jgi:hypothetical protein